MEDEEKKPDHELHEAVEETEDKSFATHNEQMEKDGKGKEMAEQPKAEKAQPFKSAKESFDSFKEPEKPADVAARMLQLAKSSPKAGAVAKLFNDEVNAVGGYDAYKPLFYDDPEAVWAIDHIISEEEEHKRILTRLFNRLTLGSREPLIDPKAENR